MILLVKIAIIVCAVILLSVLYWLVTTDVEAELDNDFRDQW
jgi:nitrogen fixation-related uncharacterized protein